MEPSFRIWNSPSGIPSPPLSLFVVMLPKAHLTSHSMMSGSRWVITPSWLSQSWRSFLYSSVSSHLFLISSASVRSIPFLSFIEPIFAWNVPLVSLIFLKRSRLFFILLFSSISLHWSLRKETKASSLVCFMFYHPHTQTLSKACPAWEVEHTGLQGLDVTSAVKCQLCHSLALLTEKHGIFSRLNCFHVGKTGQIMPISFDSLGPYKE